MTVRGRQIALFHVNEAYYALTDRCPHEGGSLCAGLLVGRLTSKGPGTYDLSRPKEFVQCSWHGWEFDIRAAGNEIIEISAAEKARWQQAVQPVYDAWIGEMNRRGRNGRAMFNDLLAITGQPPRA